MELDTRYVRQSPGVLFAEINQIFDDCLRENTRLCSNFFFKPTQNCQTRSAIVSTKRRLLNGSLFFFFLLQSLCQYYARRSQTYASLDIAPTVRG